MPVQIQNLRPDWFGPGCIFAITNWKGFLGNLDSNQAIVTGTLAEVDSPWGTAIQVAVANSYARFNLTPVLPTGQEPSSVFVTFLIPSAAGNHALAWWGTSGVNRRIRGILSLPAGDIQGALWGDDVSQGPTPVNT